ncbi:hypothetical protein QWY90_14045 [Flavobacterium paronense]|uniref:Lipoprotein n=1 Tax=Flavobacterium paronense TaxID=1392775 RepID=A0ABV5GEQ3_9FLAO|nr:hypothetical protein [Flavobacterium paronense]MDN3678432.1 hypothetical protein [Flavobacterium paronense]
MKKIVYLFISSVILIGCKIKDENVESETAQPQEKYGFKVTLNAISKTTDDFCLLYTEDGTINFGESVVWMPVPGKQEEQQVDFYFPKDVYPTQIRLDLGLKQTEKDTIYLKSIHFDYNGKKLDIVGQQLGLFFRADENHCKFDPTTGAVVPVVKNGKAEHPSIYPQETILGPALLKLGQQ